MSAAAIEPITSRSIWMTAPQLEPGESIALVLLRDLNKVVVSLSADVAKLLEGQQDMLRRQDKTNGSIERHDREIRVLQGEDRYEEGRAAGVMQEHERVTGQVGKIWTIGTDLFRVDIAIVLALGMVTGWLVDWIR